MRLVLFDAHGNGDDEQDGGPQISVRLIASLCSTGAISFKASASISLQIANGLQVGTSSASASEQHVGGDDSAIVSLRLLVYLDISQLEPQSILAGQLLTALVPSPIPNTRLNLIAQILPDTERDDVAIQPTELLPQLLPFQRRSLLWMLDRETGSGTASEELRGFWEHVNLPLTNQSLFLNRMTSAMHSGIVQDIQTSYVPGGILADEMGLGKTIMLIALVLSHRMTAESQPSDQSLLEEARARSLQLCSATLVITPMSIRDQWLTEIEMHAPSLRVGVFTPDTTDDDLESLDVVLTTYEALTTELNFSRGPVDRARRYARKYEPRTSKLVTRLWWRVVFDEAQMVATSTTKAAEMALLIPRVHPWAVSGTPTSLTGALNDMLGMFKFLDMEEWVELARFAKLRPNATRLLKSHSGLVSRRLSRFMHRATKQSLANELVLPTQHEHVVSLCFDRIQQSHYDFIEDQRDEIGGTNDDGVPTFALKPRNSKLEPRSLIVQMRQACCHPQVGAQNQRLLGNDLRTMSEVLDIMLRQSISLIYQMQHRRISTSVDVCHMYEYQGMFRPAMDLYVARLRETRELVRETREAIDRLLDLRHAGHNTVEAESSTNQQERNANDDPYDAFDEALQENTAGGDDIEISDRFSSNDELSVLRNRLNNWTELEHRLLYFIATAYYHVGQRIKNESRNNTLPDAQPSTSEHALSEQGKAMQDVAQGRDQETGFTLQDCEENERVWYEHAEELRRATLRTFEGLVEHLIGSLQPQFEAMPHKIQEDASTKLWSAIGKPRRSTDAMIIELPNEFRGGIKLSEPFEQLHEIVLQLNAQWKLLVEWRTILVRLLLLPLDAVQEEDETTVIEPGSGSGSKSSNHAAASTSKSAPALNSELPNAPTGEEYGHGLDIQEQANVYQYSYNQLLSDRLALLTSLRRDVERRFYGTTELQHQLFEQRKQFSLKPQQQALSDLITLFKTLTRHETTPRYEVELGNWAVGVLSQHLEFQTSKLDLLRE
eukprot:jgi/Hompol1/6515/HPOL_005020-RA